MDYDDYYAMYYYQETQPTTGRIESIDIASSVQINLETQQSSPKDENLEKEKPAILYQNQNQGVEESSTMQTVAELLTQAIEIVDQESEVSKPKEEEKSGNIIILKAKKTKKRIRQ